MQLDKASIIGDAINYIKELHQEVQIIESEIAGKENTYVSVDRGSGGSMVSDSGENAVKGAISLGAMTAMKHTVDAQLNNQVATADAENSSEDIQDQSPEAVDQQKMVEVNLLTRLTT